MKVKPEGLNVAVFNIVVSHENYEQLFLSVGYQTVWCGFSLKLSVGALELIFVICLVRAPGIPGRDWTRAEDKVVLTLKEFNCCYCRVLGNLLKKL